jgi:hypothetical protein
MKNCGRVKMNDELGNMNAPGDDCVLQTLHTISVRQNVERIFIQADLDAFIKITFGQQYRQAYRLKLFIKPYLQPYNSYPPPRLE